MNLDLLQLNDKDLRKLIVKYKSWARPVISFAADVNTGFYKGSADQISFAPMAMPTGLITYLDVCDPDHQSNTEEE